METNHYIELKNLEVYRLSRELCTIAWKIFNKLNFEDRKHIGDQFLRSVDSIGANIAEGYGRFHYMDKVRFYYNSRGSHFEAFFHWLELMAEREKISTEEVNDIQEKAGLLLLKLNNFIKSTIQQGKNSNSKKT